MTKEEIDKSVTVYNLLHPGFYCEVCGGALHEWFECTTKKRLDKLAKKHGEEKIWGAWKYEKYFKGIKATYSDD